MYVYRSGALLYGPGDPNADIRIDENSVVFTMDYARQHDIWPRPKPETGTGAGGGGASDGSAAAVEQVRVVTRTTVAVARPIPEGQGRQPEPLRKPSLRKPSYARR